MKCSTVYILPHPPELFSFYKETETAKAAGKTVEAYDCILDEIAAELPEVIVFIQSLGGIYPQGISFHIPKEKVYRAEYEAFVFKKAGIRTPTAFQVPVDQLLSAQIQKSLSQFERSTKVLEDTNLPLPALIFLDLYRQKGLIPPKIVVISVSLESSKRHYEYGTMIARALASDQENSVVVASGQLSHKLSRKSTAGYLSEAKDFDMDFVNYLEKGRLDQFMAMDPFLLDDVAEDLYKVTCTSLGILKAHEQKCSFEKYSYEAPQGIGYLVGKLVSSGK